MPIQCSRLTQSDVQKFFHSTASRMADLPALVETSHSSQNGQKWKVGSSGSS